MTPLLLVESAATSPTWAASFAPLSASTVTVAIWPALTLPTSDSLNGTTSFIELRSLSTANDELDVLEEPDEGRPDPVAPAAAAPAPEDEPLLEELSPELEARLVPPPET